MNTYSDALPAITVAARSAVASGFGRLVILRQVRVATTAGHSALWFLSEMVATGGKQLFAQGFVSNSIITVKNDTLLVA